MYLLLVIVVYILFSKFFVDWKRWEEFYSTILYFVVCNLAYNFIFYEHTLWKYQAKTVEWLNHTLIEMVFSFFIIPVVIMIYLRFFPSGRRKYFYVAVWVGYFSLIEYLFSIKGLFVYENGWNLAWSAIFNLIMFTLIRIHHQKPIIALIVSIPLITILLLFFHPTLTELK